MGQLLFLSFRLFCLLLPEIGIRIICRGNKILFDVLRRDPPQQIQKRSCLVVGSRSTSTAKRLLIYHSTGRLVVYVEVSGGVCQPLREVLNGCSVGRENSSGEGIVGRGVEDIQCFLQLFGVVNKNGQDRSERMGIMD